MPPPAPVAPGRSGAPGVTMLERLVGARPAVWLAASALVLGGIYLTAWAIRRQFLGPTGRTIAGLLLAAAMIGAGEYFRTRIARITAAPSAAGWLVVEHAPRFARADPAPFGRVPVAAGLALAVVVPGLVRSPLLTGEAVGARPVLNALVPGLLVSALAALLCWRRLPDDRWCLRRACGAGAGVLAFAWLTLAIRQARHGTSLVGPATEAELYTYSAAWVVFGLALFAGGVGVGHSASRRGGALVLGLVTPKVFLVDTARLAGLYRVISLIGLGLGLLVIAWAYQRFVESREATAESGTDDRWSRE